MFTWTGNSTETNWTVLFPFDTRKQWADILTEGAPTTIQWKSVMRLFDIHPQPKKINCGLSE